MYAEGMKLPEGKQCAAFITIDLAAEFFWISLDERAKHMPKTLSLGQYGMTHGLPRMLDLLDEFGIKATFFVVGDWVTKYPESVKALHDAGHEVMSHSDTHAHYNSLSTEEITADLQASSDKIKAVTGVAPTLIRCPYGEYDDHVIRAIRDFGMEPIQWDVDSLDWKEISAAEITQRVTSKVQPGSIVLFHNAALHTPEALPGILEYLIGQGYTVVPISELIWQGTYNTDYTIDHTGRQFPAESNSQN